MGTKTLTEETCREQILKQRGNLAAVGRAFGISRQAVHDYVRKHEALGAVVVESREACKDEVVGVLISRALAGEAWAVCFFLKTQAKDRGYIERSEVTGKDGAALNPQPAAAPTPEELASGAAMLQARGEARQG